jgi:hypothetical protein
MFQTTKTTNASAFRIDLRQKAQAVVAGAVTINASSHECKSKKKKESGTPKNADPYPPRPHLHPPPLAGEDRGGGAARPLQRALAHRRSTTALAKGSHRP